MLINLLKFDLRQLTVFGKIFQSLFLSNSLVLIVFYMMQPSDVASQISPLISIIWPALTVVNFTYIIFGKDFDDGNLEMLLSVCDSYKIILSKFISLFLIVIFANFLVYLIIFLVLPLSLKQFLCMILSGVLVSMLSCAMAILISSIEIYFETGNNLLSILIIPFLIPMLILAGMVISEINIKIIYIMLGIDMTICPIIIWMSSFLISNIYN